jgi:formylglycine-generating enzyme required for sulfatase activity
MASWQPGSLSPGDAAPRNARPTALGLSSRFSHSAGAMLFFLVLTPLAGCGSDPPPNPTGAPAQVNAPLENPVNAPAEEQPAPRPAPRKPAVAAQAEPQGLDPSIDPHDVFEVSATEPTFERESGPDGPVSMNRFDAAFPAKGSTSSDFQTDASPEPPAVVPHKSAEEPQPAKRPEKPSAKSHSSTKPARRDSEERSDSEKTDGESKKSLPPGFRAISAYGDSTVGWPLRIFSKIDGAEMALVTGGVVTVGHDGEPPESSPQIRVELDSFYMDITEVTLDRYERYRKAINDERGPRAVQEPENSKSPSNFPVLGVALKQAEFYAHWAHKELPTEAEWERAARGEAAFPHPWGNGRVIWSQARKRDTITAVKTFRTDVSPFGIYDLAGNAREWCTDRWSPTAFAEAQKLSRTPLRNWKGAHTAQPADFHVVKGNGPDWDAWYRVGMSGTQHHEDVGFRCVLRLNEKSER